MKKYVNVPLLAIFGVFLIVSCGDGKDSSKGNKNSDPLSGKLDEPSQVFENDDGSITYINPKMLHSGEHLKIGTALDENQTVESGAVQTGADNFCKAKHRNTYASELKYEKIMLSGYYFYSFYPHYNLSGGTPLEAGERPFFLFYKVTCQ